MIVCTCRVIGQNAHSFTPLLGALLFLQVLNANPEFVTKMCKLCLFILPCLQGEGTMVFKTVVLSPFMCYFCLHGILGKETGSANNYLLYRKVCTMEKRFL